MNEVLQRFYEKYSDPSLVLDIIEDCLGYRLLQNGTRINWFKNFFKLLLQSSSLIRLILMWIYWDQEPYQLGMSIIKWWNFPKNSFIFVAMMIIFYPICSKTICLIYVYKNHPSFRIIMSPFKVIAGDGDIENRLLDESYKLYMIKKIKKIIFIHELARLFFPIVLIAAYSIGPIEGKSIKQLLILYFWSILFALTVTESLKQIMCIMMVIYVSCLSVYFLVNNNRTMMGIFRTYDSLIHGLTWLSKANKSLRVVIGLFVFFTWTMSILVLFLLTTHRPPLFLHIAGTLALTEMAGCLIMTLITVSFVTHHVQRIVRLQLYKLPKYQYMSLVNRVKFNNILSLSMARNAFSCFDFFEIQQQFIFVVRTILI